MRDTSVVIVGAGAAGLGTANALRRHGHEGPIVLIGDEPTPPYDRPPLSKQFLKGEWDEQRLALSTPERLEALDVTLVLGQAARSVDLGQRIVRLADGRDHRYENLVIATGVRPRRLPGDDLPGVHVLRTAADARSLRESLHPGCRLLVVGAGFLGLEVASTAQQLGVKVCVVEPLSEPLANRLGTTVATRLVERHQANGVDLRAGIGVDGFLAENGSRVDGAQLADGSVVPCDVVLVAVGCVPEVDWLAGSGLDCSDGVVCDEYGRAADGVWAVGDVLRWWHPRHQRHRRIEHRTHATDSADVVAQNILGAQRPFDPVPYFWTDQWDVKLQVAGDIPDGLDFDHVDQGDTDSFVGLFHDTAGVTGVVGWNAPGQVVKYRRGMAKRP